MRRTLKAVRFLALIVPWLAILPARAQDTNQQNNQPPRKQPGFQSTEPLDLAKSNLEHVAASAAQIKSVLIRDPGLLVELKRWVAKEATDNGQMVDDSALTDSAIFDRLERDIVFRSVATRMVQRYGYLLPSVNPDSDEGKQNELVLKERARRIVQVEAQEDAQAAAQAQREAARAAEEQCDDQMGQNCAAPSKPTHRRSTTPSETQPSDEDNLPLTPAIPEFPSPGLMRTGTGGSSSITDTDLKSGSGTDTTAIMQQLQGMQGGGGDMSSALAGLGSEDDLESAMGGSKFAKNLAAAQALGAFSGTSFPMPLDLGSMSGGGENPAEEAAGKTSGNGESGGRERNAASYVERRNGREKETTPVAMVHRSNPYADIPSLYDMYVQASAKSRTPERFGIDVFRNESDDSDAIPMDLPVGPDYVIGPGDTLAIDVWGGISQRMFRTVDRSGRVSLPEAGPVLVSGRTLGDVQDNVQQLLRTQFRNVSADVSLSKLRTVRVYVVGDVTSPGAYDISRHLERTPFRTLRLG
jgi:hypothetical protein